MLDKCRFRKLTPAGLAAGARATAGRPRRIKHSSRGHPLEVGALLRRALQLDRVFVKARRNLVLALQEADRRDEREWHFVMRPRPPDGGGSMMTVAMRDFSEPQAVHGGRDHRALGGLAHGGYCVGQAFFVRRHISLVLVALASMAAAEVPSLRQVRFSPDGQHVLAQDDSQITVLTVQPFRVVFRAPAEGARLAEFTPDSQDIVFIKGGMRRTSHQLALSASSGEVERWSIAARALTESTKIPLSNCPTLELSPDGRSLAGVQFDGTLRIVENRSGSILLERRNFGQIFSADLIAGSTEFGDPGSADIRFSPDGRFVLALPVDARGQPLLWDIHGRERVPRRSGLKRMSAGFSKIWKLNFTFTAPNRIVFAETYLVPGLRAATAERLRDATIVEVPSGKVLKRTKLPQGPLFRTANPRFVRIHPYGPWARDDDPDNKRTCAVDLSTGFVITSETAALDVYGDHYVAERRNGGLGLYAIGKGLQAAVSLDAN